MIFIKFNKKKAVSVYSIKDLEKLSGIKAHTIRIWEQRYGLIIPSRTKTNIRYYEDSELKLLMNIAALNKNGVKISKIATLSRTEIMEQAVSLSDLNFESNTQLDAMTLSMIEMDEQKFDRIMSANILNVGFERAMMEVVYPFLEKLSILWLTGSVSPVQENFISCLIRQKIIAAIDAEPFSTAKGTKKFMIYLPEGEQQELSLLFFHYLLKARRYKVVYLGLNVSHDDLKDAFKIHEPDYIFTLINEALHKQSVQQYVDRVSFNCPNCQLILSGYQVVAQTVNIAPHISILKSLPEVIEYVEELNEGRRTREEGRGMNDEGRGTKDEGRRTIVGELPR